MDERVMPGDKKADQPSWAPDKDSPAGRGFWGLISGAFLAAGVLGFVALQVLAPVPEQVPREVRAPLVQVQTLDLINGALSVKGNGPVRPRASVTLIAQVSGEIVETSPSLVTGGAFRKGDTLARIDPRPYRAALDQAEADRSAREADLAFADRQLERDQQLARSGAASERRRDETLNQRDRARAQIAGLEALIATRAIDLERTAITAPFDGRVFTEQIEVGSVARPGTEIARIYASDLFEIVVPLSDREAALIPGLWDTERKQSPRAVATLPFRDHTYAWDGYVDRVEAGLDPDTRTIDVVVRIPNPTSPGRPIGETGSDTLANAPPMLAGTYASVEIEGLKLSYALIPRPALRDGNTIWIVGADQVLKIITVDIVQDQGPVVAIRSPQLENGARIVTSDLGIASNGLIVRVAGADPLAP